ncbi:hypothetical protein B0T17DRAFT_109779 [Bombardia bombarda]|uniref:ATPase AAA-type core domain-containing protein n=1 Tax=Bombardia bombarda TaxID=252184 RepID=A0AA40CH82_9PEZI|nr:hypothetical protein B0T17DRAFT_109779 [Bombardia bombarda]
MGSVAVLAMAEDVVAGRQPLHPFFTPNRLPAPAVEQCPTSDSHKPADDSILSTDGAISEKPDDDTLEKASSRQAKRRKGNPETGDTGDDDPPKKPRAKKRTKHSNGPIVNHFIKLDKGSEGAANENGGTENTAPGVSQQEEGGLLSVTQGDQVQDGGPATGLRAAQLLDNCGNSNHTPLPPSQVPPSMTDGNAEKPKKLLKLNTRTGTIGSPPKPKPAKVVEGKTEDGKKRSPKAGGKPASRIMRIVYGTDPETRIRVGEKIDNILSGQCPTPPPPKPTEPLQPTVQETPGPEIAKPKAPKSLKTPHPFFSGKAKKSNAPSEEPGRSKPEPSAARPKLFTATPCSPKKPRAGAPSAWKPQFGTKSMRLKFPGSKLPAWPSRDMMHVRGGEPDLGGVQDLPLIISSRKSKGHAVKLNSPESILDSITRGLDVPAVAEAVRNINTDEPSPAPPELRIPQKHFESGSKLQSRILPELRTFKKTSSLTKKTAEGKRLAAGNDGRAQPPPQLASLFSSISSCLSAFDKSQCETANWVQKYAPTAAVEVLQPGKEAFLLREWLQALMVQSVDTGSTENDKSKKAKGPAAGKKKKRKKMDGFIVSSGDEAYELEEESDGEDWLPSGSRGIMRKTVVRPGILSKVKEAAKIANSLVISGPHGCGKTASVYAVAKELDFEVFEINSCSRRNGKDILDKIGDMTRNHLVQQRQPSNQAGDGDSEAPEDEVAKDIKSGKQATMNAFFKPQAIATKPKAAPQASAPVQQKEAKKEPSRNQRQSLILLEEVDILYAEDKQFWATVLELISQSKRPFIMTCNDETLVPLLTLKLHGIFRLSPPPRELAIDRLLLVAANEGHALARDAIEALYESRNCDLRAATMDLQYWCQIGVGDRRGGFDWFYLRWPKGIDLDENKEVVRVVSEGTYKAGMNWLGRDSIVDPKTSPRLIEEEILDQTWELWGLDDGHWQGSAGLSFWADSINHVAATPTGRLGALQVFDDLSEAMSMADISSCKSFAAFTGEPLDVTAPDLPAKARDDFILGLPYLDTTSITQYDSLTTLLPSAIKSLAKSCLQTRTEALQNHSTPELNPLDESHAITCIQNSFKHPPAGTPAISRIDFAFAFDPIAVADTGPLQAVSYLDPSVFDRALKLITLDVAPFVRSIVAYDLHLQKQRLRLSNLVSEGGGGVKAAQPSSSSSSSSSLGPAKRMRTTRAALSALEGGSRSTVRSERWFKANINPHLVMRTAGTGWWGEDSGFLLGDAVEEGGSSKIPAAGCGVDSEEEQSDIHPPKKPLPRGTRGRKRKKPVVLEDSGDELASEPIGSEVTLGIAAEVSTDAKAATNTAVAPIAEAATDIGAVQGFEVVAPPTGVQ